MVRALLAAGHAADVYEDLDLVSIVLSLDTECKGSWGRSFIAFLEEMMHTRPDVFGLGAGYYVNSMAYTYVNSGRAADITRPLQFLLDDAREIDESAFDLLDLLRLAGRHDDARALALTLVGRGNRRDLMPWAMDELTETAFFFVLHDFIEAGGSPSNLDDLSERLREIRCAPQEEHLSAMIAHRSGTAGRRFERPDLIGKKSVVAFNRYLLTLDFGRALHVERGLEPVVADTFRHFVHLYLTDRRSGPKGNPLTIDHGGLEAYLAGQIAGLSMKQLPGVATLIAMRHYYTYLGSVDLLDRKKCEGAERICDDLWQNVEQAMGTIFGEYAFLLPYR